MDHKYKLITNMWIFSTIVIAFFALLIVNEKKYTLFENKVEEKLISYIDTNYQEIKNDLQIQKIKYQPEGHQYKIKLTNKQNKNLFFYVFYQNKKITSTYQKDYIEGTSLLKFYKNELEKEINDGKTLKTTLSFTKDFNSYTSDVKENLMSNEMKELPIYQLQTELKPNSFQISDITSSIQTYHQYIISLGCMPKSYDFRILFDDFNYSFEVKNVTPDLINNHLVEIINGIINKDVEIMNKYSITYQYLY